MADKAKMELIEPRKPEEPREPKEPKEPFTGRLEQPGEGEVEYQRLQ
jgi:hypothetical protein